MSRRERNGIPLSPKVIEGAKQSDHPLTPREKAALVAIFSAPTSEGNTVAQQGDSRPAGRS